MSAIVNRIAPDTPPSSEQLLAQAAQRTRRYAVLLDEKNAHVEKQDNEIAALRRELRALKTLHAGAESLAPLPGTEYARVTRDNQTLRNEAAQFRAAVRVVRDTISELYRLKFDAPDYRMDVARLLGQISRALLPWDKTSATNVTNTFFAPIDMGSDEAA